MTLELVVESRENVGKGVARQLRRDGKIPAVIYGGDKEPVKISVSTKEINHEMNKVGFMSNVVNLNLDGKLHKVLPKAVELHPVTDLPEHTDFLRVNDDTKVKVNIPVKFLNREACAGVKKGGTLNIVRREIEFIVNANSIPAKIVVDVEKLNIGDSIHIDEIELDERIVPTIAWNFTIATVVGRTAELKPMEEAIAEEEEALAAVADEDENKDQKDNKDK